MLLPHLLKFCEEYLVVKVAEAESGGGSTSWLSPTMQSQIGDERVPTPPEIQALDRPRVLCRCGHGELWHKQPNLNLLLQPRQPEDGLRGPPVSLAVASSSSPSLRRALPTTDCCASGTASICGGRLVLSQAGAATLQQSASAPIFGRLAVEVEVNAK